MKINDRITSIMITVSLIPILAILLISVDLQESLLKSEIETNIILLSQSRLDYVKTYLGEMSLRAQFIASNPQIINLLKADQGGIDFKSLQVGAGSTLESILEKNGDIYGIKISTPSGIILSSTDVADIGMNISDENYLIHGMKGAYYGDVHISNSTGQIGLDISYPVVDDGKALGVMIIEFDTDKLYTAMVDTTGGRRTADAYLINSKKLMISPSRFGGNELLNRRVYTDNAMMCLTEKNNHVWDEIVVGLDSRGVSVWGSHVYIPEADWCILVEMDESEILQPIQEVKQIFSLFILVALVFILTISFFISKTISKPIQGMTKTIERISMGQLDAQIQGRERRDEIGDLARAFDRTLVSLKLAMSMTAPELKKQTDKLKQEKEGIVEEKDYLKNLFDVMPSGVFTLDKNRRVNIWNKKAEEISGYTKEEVMGKECIFYADEPCKKNCKAFRDDVIKPVLSEECQIRRKDGQIRTISKNIDLLKDDKGEVIGAIESFEDITDIQERHKEIQEQKVQLERFERLAVDREQKMNELRSMISMFEKKGDK